MYLQQRVHVNCAITFPLYRMQAPGCNSFSSRIMLSKLEAGIEEGKGLGEDRTAPVHRRWACHRRTDFIPVSVRMLLCKDRQVTV